MSKHLIYQEKNRKGNSNDQSTVAKKQKKKKKKERKKKGHLHSFNGKKIFKVCQNQVLTKYLKKKQNFQALP